MKVVFFDVDGVLNSQPFYEKYELSENMPLADPKAVECLAEICRTTGAVLVCSSSWRTGWDRDPAKTDRFAGALVREFSQYGIRIYDKTRATTECARPAEVLDWLIHCPEKIESFVCIDDVDFGWQQYGLKSRWLKTDYCGGGLLEEHIPQAVALLNREIPDHFLQKMIWRFRIRKQTFFTAS